MSSPTLAQSRAIESLLVARNPRGMDAVRNSLQPGYLLRAANILADVEAPIGIITGFPVAQTFETDGPAGAKVLYDTLERLGRRPYLWVEPDIQDRCFPDHRCFTLPVMPAENPGCIVVIERPGASADGRFYNIRGEDISERCQPIEAVLAALDCPVIAIGDGGNEIGMGSASEALAALPIRPAVAACDELVVGDVSNWAAYALALMLEARSGLTLSTPDIAQLLAELVTTGIVDGVTGEPTPTEDGFAAVDAAALMGEIRDILGASRSDNTGE